MVSKLITIENSEGLHARPAGVLVKALTPFKSQVFINHKGLRKNAKSIMNLLTLGIKGHEQIMFEAEGDDAQQALDFLESMAKQKFDPNALTGSLA